MANKQKKTAKDIAFEKEKQKLKHQIKDLNDCINCKNQHIRSLQQELDSRDSQIESLKNWVERLLAYTELSEEDMKKLIEKDKKQQELTNKLLGLTNFANTIGF